MNRRKVMIGDIPIGGGSPIAIQSMCSVDTADVESVIEQCGRLERAGCEIIRVAAYDRNSAAAVRSIKDKIHMPLVADFLLYTSRPNTQRALDIIMSEQSMY